MDNTKIKREINKVNELAKEYQKKNYKVYVNPNENHLPDFLKGLNYRPDLIVKSRNENIIIEVKSSESILNSDYSKIPNIIKNTEKWDFMLVLTNPKNSTSLEIEDSKSIVSENTIKKSFNKINSLLSNDENYYDIITVYLWSVCEAILRYGISQSNFNKNNINIRSILRDSHMLGIISRKDYITLSEFKKIRNKINHGELDIQTNRISIENVFNICKRIFNELFNEYLDEENLNYYSFLKSLSKSELLSEIDNIISETIFDIIDNDEINSLIASTNAYGWGIDSYDIVDIELEDMQCWVNFTFHCSGEQDENKMYMGTEITGEGNVIIDEDKNVIFSIEQAKLVSI